MLRPEGKSRTRGGGVRAPLTYREAGVDVAAGEALVRRIAACAQRTRRKGVIGGIGGFGGLFELDLERHRKPVFVSGTDSVGTKLKIACLTGRFDTVGIDLVAMCVNDILVHGAEPLFFLDYLAVWKLDEEQAAALVAGVSEGCCRAGCALVGGETAELPGIYPEGEFDLAGFAVGVVERDALIDGSQVSADDRLIGIASSGVHSNGYSLVRKIFFEQEGLDASARVRGLDRTLGEELLEPTRIYVKPVLEIIREFDVHAIAHITGGGIPGNLVRALPQGHLARVRKGSWQGRAVFDVIADMGPVEEEEMYRVFNMGLGMILVVPAGSEDPVCRRLEELGERAIPVGVVEEGERGVIIE